MELLSTGGTARLLAEKGLPEPKFPITPISRR
ncbi:hypothetical protein ACLK1Z_23010 [Escherichia coli]